MLSGILKSFEDLLPWSMQKVGSQCIIVERLPFDISRFVDNHNGSVNGLVIVII